MTAAADSISISDRMSSSSSLFVPSAAVAPLQTTVISTIAIQCLGSRMVIALLQSKDALNLRVLEMNPSLTALGEDVEESERLLNEHKRVLEKLRNCQTPMEEYFRKTQNFPESLSPVLYGAMGDSLGQAWRDLLANLELRREILSLGITFHGFRMECLQDLRSPDALIGERSIQKYTNVIDAGRKLLDKLEMVEDSTQSILRVNGWLTGLTNKLQELKNVEKKREENKLNAIYEGLKRELVDIIRSADSPETKTQKLVGLLSKVKNNTQWLSPDKQAELEGNIYSYMNELTQRNDAHLELAEFVNQMKYLEAPTFKEKYFEKLRIARSLNSELLPVIQKRINIRDDYEEILLNVLGYSETEIIQKLSQDKSLDISGALERIGFERRKQENELFELFQGELNILEAAVIRHGDLEGILSDTTDLNTQLQNAPSFYNKNVLIERCTKLHDEILEKLQIIESASNFVNNYRDITEQSFMIEHNTVLRDLEKIDQIESELWKIIKSRISVRRSYEDILKNPTQFEDDEIIELLTREDSLDAALAIQNIKDEKKLQELLQTLDFPLPESLEIARNDLQDFKSFEEIIQTLPNATEELIGKTIEKKTKILKCIEFYELIESEERIRQIKEISRLEIALFGTTHISESIYEEKINQMEHIRQMEMAESQKFEKRKISNTEVQTDDELLPLTVYELPLPPPPLLMETDTQTKEMDARELRNTETQTLRVQSAFSATQTNLESVRKPDVAMQTQTSEEPEIIYLYQEPAPVKLRNNQTQTIEEYEKFPETIRKRSEMLIEETSEEFESKKLSGRNSEQKIPTSSMSTQTKPVTPELQDEDILLMKSSDVSSVAKLLLNTECQTEDEDSYVETKFEQPTSHTKFLMAEATFNQAQMPIPGDSWEKYEKTVEYHQETFESKTQEITQPPQETEGTKIEFLTPQMSVRDRVKSWQITSPTDAQPKHDPIWQVNNNLKSQISRHISWLEGKNNNANVEPEQSSIGNYRLLFQSPIDDRKPEYTKPVTVSEETTKQPQLEKFERKGSVAEYRKMFQSFADSYLNEYRETSRQAKRTHPSYWRSQSSDQLSRPDVSDENSERITEAARERILAMYRKLTEPTDHSQQDRQERETTPRSGDLSLQPSYPTYGYKSAEFGQSEESLEGICFSSSSEISMPAARQRQIVPPINKYSTLPIRPSKFVPMEFQESDYESDYECKIPPMWIPPGGSKPRTNSLRASPYRPIPRDYRSQSVPAADLNGNQESNVHSKSMQSTTSTFDRHRQYFQGPLHSKCYQQPKLKPIPPPKPLSRKTSPGGEISEEIIKREAFSKSEMIKQEQDTFILPPSKTTSEGIQIVKQPAYFVSTTGPPITVPNTNGEETITKTTSYESREERFETKIEEIPVAGIPSFHASVRNPYGATITTFARQKELMHPILYELDDKCESDEQSLYTQKVENFEESRMVCGERVASDGLSGEKSITKFTPSKFIPMTTSEEEFSSAAEEEFIIPPKWKPLGQIEKSKFGSVKPPAAIKIEESPKDPAIFYMACDFSCECGIVPKQK